MKAKTHSGLKKRIKVTAKGKLIFKKPGRNHLLWHKSKRTRRGARKGLVAHPSDEHAIKSLLKI